MNLADWLKQSHPQSEQLSVLEGICDALHQAHSGNQLRGDIAPTSIEFGQSGGYEILSGAAAPAGYRAPEARSGAGGPMAAIFSAGVIFYEILAGKHPFPGGATSGPAEPLRSVRRDLPSELTDAVMACLEVDPEWRPKDLSYVLQVVRRLRGSTPAPAPASRPAPRMALESKPKARTETVRRRPSSRGRPPLMAIAVGATLLIIGGVVLWLRSVPSGPSKPSAKPAPTVAGTPAATTSTSPAVPTPAPSSPVLQPSAGPSVKPTPTPTPGPVAVASPIASPAHVAATPTPSLATPTPTPRPSATLAPVIAATPTPVVATPPPTPVPTPVPVATPPPAAPAPPTEPALLKSIAPPMMAPNSTSLYDLHGSGLRAELRAVFLKGRDVAPGINVVRQKFVNSTKIQVLVRVEEGAGSGGGYSVVLVDAEGRATNGAPFQIGK
jgi:serine/threonine protein kinase